MGNPVVKIRIFRKKKILPGSKAADDPLTLDQELKRSIRNRYTLRRHGMYIKSVCILRPSYLIETSETELHKFVECLVENYNEFVADGILIEIPCIRGFLKAGKVPKEESVSIEFHFMRFCCFM
ncbi:uncharacterized protein CDAR_96311 [Caerostris darwini]|uniref:Uncharacterized protein n=1 Tax=Caerostris darwini TaxID=1538125 RepID=A0AAV4N7P4_9ARAC|nr:uncharacterized protein CDAR_96311 [Caerostris darwini]